MSVQPDQEEILREQLFALQQQLQPTNPWNNNYYQQYPPAMQKSDMPYIIIMPVEQMNPRSELNKQLKTEVENKPKENKLSTDNKDLDSIMVEAAESKPEHEPKKAILLIPNRGRLSIGGLISAIPFLPIEINVPDAISWIINGISSIISGIGQNFPFNRPTQPQMSPENMKILLRRLQTENQNKLTPILMLPEVAQTFPLLI
ncbi:hypothetical protein evm_007809 [Chilo suppressalis]|nr:hypothetical protein evm_007809 [Chilo suppressalis]